MSKAPQSLKNHGRFDPPFHFFLAPIFIANLIIAIVHLVHHFNFYCSWLVVLSIAAIVLLVRARQYPLKVKAPTTGLEGRLRLQSLPPSSGMRRSTGSLKIS